MPSMPGGDDKKEDDKAPETPEAKAEREQQVEKSNLAKIGDEIINH